ncbi:SPW repeat protein [Actinoplanes sp. KI2]|uniref:SPW repeat protein n=1 Tax=Actinoplanes sp. KI2 TaxID=2983315 RepID=UPI0021D58415|nr:SPW repeat protein [Actinoplanes sp. KI2]MCU7730303.1 SPW repeat protein [Actinoplanes sp. KI2]
MTETSRYAMADHPDLLEMRERYERVSASGPAVITDGVVLLAGLWLAISPWVIHFNTTAPDVMRNNLILGIAVGVIALGLTLAPIRMVRLSWATAVIGAWVVISQWVILQGGATAGLVINNVITGGVIALVGIAAAMILSAGSRATTTARRAS